MIYAQIADRLEQKGNYFGKALVCILCGALGIPFIVLCTCVQFNIYFSLAMLAFEYLVAEGWVPPAITMVVNTISPENKAFGTAAFLFCATMAGVISTALLNEL
jgi:MFS family permease